MEAKAPAFRLAIALTLVMFALWGLAHRLYDTLNPEFAATLGLSPAQASLAGWALSIGYYVMALPAALISRNFGFKSGIVFGLGCFAVGLFLFYPAAEARHFFTFLGAAVIVGSGLAILEVSADPLVVRLGPKESAVRRLNIAQALNPVGVVSGFFLGQWILSEHVKNPGSDPAQDLVMPLFLIGGAVLAFAFLVDNTAFPPPAIERVGKSDSTLKSFVPLWRLPLFKSGVAAQFLCAVGQTVMWGFTLRYAMDADPGLSLSGAKDVLLWSLIAFTLGRFAGTALMYLIQSALLLVIFAAGGALSTALAAIAGGRLGIECLIVASFFLSIQFPTIFASAIRDIGEHTKSGAAVLMFAAGSGAAVLAFLNVAVSPATVQMVMAVPAVSFAGIALFGLAARRADRISD